MTQEEPENNQKKPIYYLYDPYAKKKLIFPSGKSSKLIKKYVKHLKRFKYNEFYNKSLELKRKNVIKKLYQKNFKNDIRKKWNLYLNIIDNPFTRLKKINIPQEFKNQSSSEEKETI